MWWQLYPNIYDDSDEDDKSNDNDGDDDNGDGFTSLEEGEDAVEHCFRQPEV